MNIKSQTRISEFHSYFSTCLERIKRQRPDFCVHLEPIGIGFSINIEAGFVWGIHPSYRY